MEFSFRKQLFLLPTCAALTMLLFSCKTPKQLNYFRDIPDSIYTKTFDKPLVTFKEPLIQNNNILQVSILTLDPEDNAVLSMATKVNAGNTQGGLVVSNTNGFLVNNEGNIELPLVGKVKVAGLTTTIARDTIYNRISRYYRNPIVNVSLSNFNISVLGEVNNPGQYTIANEKVSVLDALVLARDLTIDAKRDNVMLIRDSAGVKRFARFDLTRSDLFNSPYFYLQQGDLVYVEPVKEKQTSKDAVTQRTIGYVTAGTGLLLSIVSIIIALSR